MFDYRKHLEDRIDRAITIVDVADRPAFAAHRAALGLQWAIVDTDYDPDILSTAIKAADAALFALAHAPFKNPNSLAAKTVYLAAYAAYAADSAAIEALEFAADLFLEQRAV